MNRHLPRLVLRSPLIQMKAKVLVFPVQGFCKTECAINSASRSRGRFGYPGGKAISFTGVPCEKAHRFSCWGWIVLTGFLFLKVAANRLTRHVSRCGSPRWAQTEWRALKARCKDASAGKVVDRCVSVENAVSIETRFQR